MQPVWTLFLFALALVILLQLRKRRKQPTSTKVYARRISGAQVAAYLHPRISRACLMDHGTQFGKGFRRKEGPHLPHDPLCRCRVVPFSFTSSEVFNGALRRELPVEGTLPEVPSDQARRLIERLRAIGDDPLPGTAEGYLQAVGLEQFEEAHRPAVVSFLRERWAHLHRQGAAGPGPDGQGASSQGGTREPGPDAGADDPSREEPPGKPGLATAGSGAGAPTKRGEG